MTKIRLVHRDSLSCEAIVREMPNGELLMVSQCGGTSEPSPQNRVYFWHSPDNGETWKPGGLLWPEDGRAVYQTEVSVEEGEVTVYITLHDGSFLNWECVMAKSSDCGHTWQNAGPPPCFPRYAFLRRKKRTPPGILLQPYQSYPVSEELDWLLRRQGTKIYKGTPLIPYNENGVLRSADNGKSWQAYPAIRLPQSENLWHWGEPTVCELPDGTVAMLVRVNRAVCGARIPITAGSPGASPTAQKSPTRTTRSSFCACRTEEPPCCIRRRSAVCASQTATPFLSGFQATEWPLGRTAGTWWIFQGRFLTRTAFAAKTAGISALR